MRGKPLAEWRGMRALLERQRSTVELVAQATGRSPRTIRLVAEREGWRLDRVPDEDIAERVRVVIAMLLERVESLGRKALEEDGKIDKREIDGLLSLIKGLDKIIETTRSEETAKKKQTRRDEDLREVLQHIHRRILELAEELVAEMVGSDDRVLGGGAHR
jgi:hypothetical protein